MLFYILENNLPLDEVVFYDTGMEFQAIYDIQDKILPLLKEKGIKYTELYPAVPFRTKMFDIDVQCRDGSTHKGYSWCGGVCRWGTSDKLTALKKYIGDNYDYVGIAADETDRIEKEKRTNRILPLVDAGITEQQALEYCYSKGYCWEEDGIRLYDIFDRVSCWCCGNKNNRELYGMYHYLPNYFASLKELQRRNRLPFRGAGKDSVFDIERKIITGTLRFKTKKLKSSKSIKIKQS
jgi:hypothetical protein